MIAMSATPTEEARADAPSNTGDHTEAPVLQEEQPFTPNESHVGIREEVAQLNECYMLAVRVLKSLMAESVPTQVNAAEMMDEFDAQEQYMFSAKPTYVSEVLEQEEEKQDRRRRSSHAVSHYRVESMAPVTNQFRRNSRAYVDPSNPLPLPFQYTKRNNATARGAAVQGTHRENIHVKRDSTAASTPKSSQRPSLSQARQPSSAHTRSSTTTLEGTHRPSLKVGHDFVPACADPHYQPVKHRASVSA